jgi:hypothetical protein
MTSNDPEKNGDIPEAEDADISSTSVDEEDHKMADGISNAALVVRTETKKSVEKVERKKIMLSVKGWLGFLFNIYLKGQSHKNVSEIITLKG